MLSRSCFCTGRGSSSSATSGSPIEDSEIHGTHGKWDKISHFRWILSSTPNNALRKTSENLTLFYHLFRGTILPYVWKGSLAFYTWGSKMSFTYVKHIIRLIKITIFPWADEYIPRFFMYLDLLDFFRNFFLKCTKNEDMKLNDFDVYS